MSKTLNINEEMKYQYLGWAIVAIITGQLIFNFALVIQELYTIIKDVIIAIKNKILKCLGKEVPEEETDESNVSQANTSPPKPSESFLLQIEPAKNVGEDKEPLAIDKDVKDTHTIPMTLMAAKRKGKKKVKKLRKKGDKNEIDLSKTADLFAKEGAKLK